jgi:hypothetical protein
MLERIKNYKTVKSNSVEEFDTEIEKYLKDGWLLFGNIVVVVFNHNSIQYIQTLIKG